MSQTAILCTFLERGQNHDLKTHPHVYILYTYMHPYVYLHT